MELPKLERKIFPVKIDSVEMRLEEPTLDQVQEIFRCRKLSGTNPELLDALVNVIAQLMGQYPEKIEDKRLFVKGLSTRQIGLIIDGIINFTEEEAKKVSRGSGESSTSLQEKQAGH